MKRCKRSLEAEKTEADKEKLAKRQANAAVALLRLGQPDAVWPLLKHGPDPRVRSYLIHYLSPRGADPGAIVRRLDEEKEVSIRRALLLILGEFGPEQLSAADRGPLILKVLQLYRDDPDAGMHGAADWLLRQWGQGDKLKEIDRAWAEDRRRREEKLEQIRKGLAEEKGRGDGYWYVNGQGQTMVVVPGPAGFLMGSPPTEAGREGGPEGEVEKQVEKRIGRSFAIAAREVTVEQFTRRPRFKDFDYNKGYSPTPDCPVNDMTWFDAAEYCNWLTEQELPEEQWEDQRCYLPNADGKYCRRHEAGAGLPGADRVSPAHGGGMGIRLSGRGRHQPLLRRDGGTAGQVRLVHENSLDREMLPGKPGDLGVCGGVLKPNDLGLFDMLGNAAEWCQDRAAPYKPGEDMEDNIKDITDKTTNDIRSVRGGALFNRAWLVRSASRNRLRPSYTPAGVGFRPARTFR